MAIRKLTKNADDLRGTSGADRFDAPLFTTALGTQTSTLQTGDVLVGAGGKDRLSGELLAQFGTYFARPELRSVEVVKVSAIDGGGLSNNNEVVLDLVRSRKVDRVISDDSNTSLEIRNARSADDFALIDYNGDFGGLEVGGVDRETAKVSVKNTEAAFVEIDRKGGEQFKEFKSAIVNSSFTLDVSTSTLNLVSSGNSSENSVYLWRENYDEINVNAKSNLDISASEINAARLNVKGDSLLTISDDVVLSEKFDASASTGGVRISDLSGSVSSILGSQGADWFGSVRSSSALNVDLGAGNDFFLIDEALDLNPTGGVDKLQGGAGVDTLAARIASGLTASQGTNLAGFESLTLLANSGGTFDLAGLRDVKTFNIQGASDTLNFTNVASGTTFNDQGEFSALTISAPVGPDQGSVNLSVGIDESGSFAGDPVDGGVYTVNRFNTLNLESNGGDTVDPGSASDENVVQISAANTEILKITGAEDIEITSSVNAFSTVDGSAATGDIDMRNVDIGAAGATITGGSGNDYLVGGNGADTFDLSKGGSDRVLFDERADSELAIGQADTVSGFDTAGNDTLVFENAAGAVFSTAVSGVRSLTDANGGGAELVFAGNARNYVEAQAALTDARVGAEDFAAVFDSSTNTLYIDADSNGLLNGSDFQIIVNDANDALTKLDFALV